MFLFSYYSYVGDVGREGLLLSKENILIKVLVKVLSNPNMHGKCTCGKQKWHFHGQFVLFYK